MVLILGTITYQLRAENTDLKTELAEMGNIEPVISLTDEQIEQIDKNTNNIQTIIDFINKTIASGQEQPEEQLVE